ncbi:hypothetical protein [Actinoplanes xinjiangensis]|uniref:hypothetical protein n=1 Tax=Actinoplanes xinjiangensis TaxID=512350 RepID=UPI003415F62B
MTRAECHAGGRSIERRHLDAPGVTGGPERMHDYQNMEEALADFSFACTARTVAAEMSTDIVGGVRRSDATVEGKSLSAVRSTVTLTPIRTRHRERFPSQAQCADLLMIGRWAETLSGPDVARTPLLDFRSCLEIPKTKMLRLSSGGTTTESGVATSTSIMGTGRSFWKLERWNLPLATT